MGNSLNNVSLHIKSVWRVSWMETSSQWPYTAPHPMWFNAHFWNLSCLSPNKFRVRKIPFKKDLSAKSLKSQQVEGFSPFTDHFVALWGRAVPADFHWFSFLKSHKFLLFFLRYKRETWPISCSSILVSWDQFNCKNIHTSTLPIICYTEDN